MMAVVGSFHVVQGLAALFQNRVYRDQCRYIFSFDLTTCGGGPAPCRSSASCGRVRRHGRVWARSVGIGLAVLSMITNFAFVPYYPVWSLLIIVIDVFVIWALWSSPGRMHGPDDHLERAPDTAEPVHGLRRQPSLPTPRLRPLAGTSNAVSSRSAQGRVRRRATSRVLDLVTHRAVSSTRHRPPHDPLAWNQPTTSTSAWSTRGCRTFPSPKSWQLLDAGQADPSPDCAAHPLRELHPLQMSPRNRARHLLTPMG